MEVPGAQFKSIEVIGYCDFPGKGGGIEVAGQRVGNRYYLYHGHFFAGGVSVIDVTDPANPEIVNFIPSPNKDTWHIKVRVADNIMILPCEYAGFLPNRDQKLAVKGVRIFDAKNPLEPKELGFWECGGNGVHRSWWNGGRYAYLTAGQSGVKGAVQGGRPGQTRAVVTLDISDPANPKEISKYWLPGQRGEPDGVVKWRPGDTIHPHGPPMVIGDRMYVGYWDGGFAIIDVSDPSNPELISHRCLYPELSGGCTHTAMALPSRKLLIVVDECTAYNCYEGPKNVWVFDIQDETNPELISKFPTPKPPPTSPYESFCQKGGRFGPHNVHEPRKGSLIDEKTIYVTWCNAGLRIFDLSNPAMPEERAYFIPPNPKKIYDPRPIYKLLDIRHGGSAITCTQDVYVDDRGYIYISDSNAGVYILKEKKQGKSEDVDFRHS